MGALRNWSAEGYSSMKGAHRMNRATEIAILKRMLAYVETGTTAVAPEPWRNEDST